MSYRKPFSGDSRKPSAETAAPLREGALYNFDPAIETGGFRFSQARCVKRLSPEPGFPDCFDMEGIPDGGGDKKFFVLKYTHDQAFQRHAFEIKESGPTKLLN